MQMISTWMWFGSVNRQKFEVLIDEMIRNFVSLESIRNGSNGRGIQFFHGDPWCGVDRIPFSEMIREYSIIFHFLMERVQIAKMRPDFFVSVFNFCTSVGSIVIRNLISSSFTGNKFTDLLLDAEEKGKN